MSDDAPSIVIAGPDERGTEALSAEAIESILSDFRAWLSEARDAPLAAPLPEMDLATVVQHFTALRQDVNLQTRASRTQTELNTQTLDRLQQALDSIKQLQAQAQGNREQERDEAVRPLLKTLLDARDALALARREVQRMLDTPLPTPPPPPTLIIQLPWWARWLGLGASIDEQIGAWRAQHDIYVASDESANRLHSILDALLVGYQMSLQRIERAMQHQGLEAIDSLGLPFDPETMEVVEVVREEGRTATEVLNEVRPGYRWRGKLFRYAQVRVAKP